MRILIADDSIVSRHLLDATLRKWGYEVIVACDGVEARERPRGRKTPKLAILDWVMPGLTGPEVCRFVREHNKDKDITPYILLLTSKSLKEDLIEGMEAGADDYITKPFDQHELKAALRAGTASWTRNASCGSPGGTAGAGDQGFPGPSIWNRSSILDVLQRELVRGSREKRPVGVVLADLDHFNRE